MARAYGISRANVSRIRTERTRFDFQMA
ncbi:MAG TPA: hypothetical protein VGK09_01360 [Rhodocyclaceae bacterium]